EVYSDVAWFVLACDLPYVDTETINTLVRCRNPQAIATAYEHPEDRLPEPLCTIYEPKCKTLLGSLANQGYFSPRRALIHGDVLIVRPANPQALVSVNKPA